MLYKALFFPTVAFLALTILAAPVQALPKEQKAEFDRIFSMNMEALTETATTVLEDKYPDTDWDQFNFPPFVYTSNPVEIGYKIAVMEPELLGNASMNDKNTVIPCYCFCNAMGHKNLLYCFLEDGETAGQYDDHAANCNICYGQAMLAFLWNNIGATHDDIIAGMEKRFQRLIDMQKKNNQ